MQNQSKQFPSEAILFQRKMGTVKQQQWIGQEKKIQLTWRNGIIFFHSMRFCCSWLFACTHDTFDIYLSCIFNSFVAQRKFASDVRYKEIWRVILIEGFFVLCLARHCSNQFHSLHSILCTVLHFLSVFIYAILCFCDHFRIECHRLFVHPVKMITKSSPIGDDWVARYLLRSIKLQSHVLTLLFHCVEMNTKWNELPDEQTQQSNSNQQTKPRRRFQSVETKSIQNRFVQDVQIMLRVTKKTRNILCAVCTLHCAAHWNDLQFVWILSCCIKWVCSCFILSTSLFLSLTLNEI